MLSQNRISMSISHSCTTLFKLSSKLTEYHSDAAVSHFNTSLLKGAIDCTFVPPRVRFRAMVKLSAAFFHDESSITIGERGGGGTKVQ